MPRNKLDRLCDQLSLSVAMYLRANLRFFGNGEPESWVEQASQIDLTKMPTVQAACAAVALRDWAIYGRPLPIIERAMLSMDKAFHEYESNLCGTWEYRASVFSHEVDSIMKAVRIEFKS